MIKFDQMNLVLLFTLLVQVELGWNNPKPWQEMKPGTLGPGGPLIPS